MYIGAQPFTKASYNKVEVLATEGQTTFNVSYSPNFVDVLVNGVELSKTDYVAVNGTSIVLNEPLALNDVVVFKVWGTFQTADAVATGDVDQTIAGVKTFSSFPVTPSAAPTEEYQAANKKYVDDTTALKLAAAFGGENQGLTTTGYQKLPGGLIIQWGLCGTGVAGAKTVTFPIAFPNAVFGVVVQITGYLTAANIVARVNSQAITLTGFDRFITYIQGTGPIELGNDDAFYIALGR